MRTGLRLQSGHGHKTAQHSTAYTPYLLLCCSSLLFLPLSTPRQARLLFNIILIPSLQRVVVLPHEAPSRVIALASVRQPYSPLIACARVRPLVDAPPFTSCSTVYVVASREATPVNASEPGREASPGVNPGIAASAPITALTALERSLCLPPPACCVWPNPAATTYREEPRSN